MLEFRSPLDFQFAVARTSQSPFPLSVSVKKPTRKWHIWFLPTHEPTLKKPKEPFFANARTDDKTLKSKFDKYIKYKWD